MRHLKTFRIFESTIDFWQPLDSTTKTENNELKTKSRQQLYYDPNNERDLAKKIEDFAKKYPESIDWLKLYSDWRITNLKPGGGIDNRSKVISSEKDLCYQFQVDLSRGWNKTWDDTFESYIEYVASVIDDKPARVTKVDKGIGTYNKYD